jgi:hypothetical protein
MPNGEKCTQLLLTRVGSFSASAFRLVPGAAKHGKRIAARMSSVGSSAPAGATPTDHKTTNPAKPALGNMIWLMMALEIAQA